MSGFRRIFFCKGLSGDHEKTDTFKNTDRYRYVNRPNESDE